MTIDFTNKRLVHIHSNAERVTVERGRSYPTPQGPLEFEIYRPLVTVPETPAVLFVSGLPDPAVVRLLGKPLKDWASYVDWARLVAASGMCAITYSNREPADVLWLVRHLRANADTLGLDPERLAVWACSGNVPTALGLISQERMKCAALLYGYLMDLEGANIVSEAARQFYFALPATTLEALPRDMPMLLVRAGQDSTPGLNGSMEHFVTAARRREIPIELLEHPEAPHAFDLLDDSPTTHRVMQSVLAFLRRNLA